MTLCIRVKNSNNIYNQKQKKTFHDNRKKRNDNKIITVLIKYLHSEFRQYRQGKKRPSRCLYSLFYSHNYKFYKKKKEKLIIFKPNKNFLVYKSNIG